MPRVPGRDVIPQHHSPTWLHLLHLRSLSPPSDRQVIAHRIIGLAGSPEDGAQHSLCQNYPLLPLVRR